MIAQNRAHAQRSRPDGPRRLLVTGQLYSLTIAECLVLMLAAHHQNDSREPSPANRVTGWGPGWRERPHHRITVSLDAQQPPQLSRSVSSIFYYSIVSSGSSFGLARPCTDASLGEHHVSRSRSGSRA